jgi:hypothetical protein
MATTVHGRVEWSLARDRDGHREYTITHLVKGDLDDGPATVLLTPGLPIPGQFWDIAGETPDPWAFCQQEAAVRRHEARPGEKVKYWTVEQKFSTRPTSRCREEQFDDPLLQPPRISGSSVKFEEEQRFDRSGRPFVTSSWEPIRGPAVQFLAGADQVRVEMNVLDLSLALVTSMRYTVNAFPIWGMPPRTVLFSDFAWSPAYYGYCLKYYTVAYVFDIDARTFDRSTYDEGSKVLRGKWKLDEPNGLWELTQINGEDPDPNNPNHFIRYRDLDGEMARAMLDGAGKPISPALNEVVTTCGQCPGGAPKRWRVGGALEAVTLTHSSGCTWSGTVDAATYTLTYSAANFRWELVRSKIGEFPKTWIAQGVLWSCLGPNVMSGPTYETYPPNVVLSAGSQPGVIPLQYYRESDFLLLGLPTVL